ncbi:PREDICTED: probable E3 ubiquitin-protein ligase ATL44 [Tarenaya hassleriana]|uniref:probable E3 ubiquitin-protein ligase ATL44 n=1 Tax=Tarenaya hassleriana TaxID=28532 RepID=UPI00053C7AE8|nr:PREDICTED: probable E3 ubiquitin-protein ligase ATL44 [Tarenaya hassleriana]
MARPSRILQTAAAAPPEQEVLAAESDMVVILSALLCALICVAGLVAVARCVWIRRFTGNSPPPPPKKGLKKKALESIPRFTFSSAEPQPATDCAICLTDFADGEEIRVLPLCGHAFHVSCIDRWLASRSSCPSCRRILVPLRCDRCGHVPAAEAEIKAAQDQPHRHHQHRPPPTTAIPAFLP